MKNEFSLLLLKIQSKYSRILFLTSKGNYNRLNIESYIRVNDYCFSDVNENPNYSQLLVELKKINNYDFQLVLCIGGGSVIDFSKLIKYYYKVKLNILKDYIISNKSITRNNLELICIPTLYGSGAEQTKFAVCYLNGKKFSVSDDSLLPKKTYYVPSLTKSIPKKIKANNLIDCFSQSFESLSATSANDISIKFANKSINKLKVFSFDYIHNWNHECAHAISEASMFCGKAINISKTTGAHALSYFLTSELKLAHGESLSITFPYIISQYSKSVKQSNQISIILKKLCEYFRCQKSDLTKRIINEFEVYGVNYLYNSEKLLENIDFDTWIKSINKQRLKNGPSTSYYDLSENSLKKFVLDIKNYCNAG